MRRYVFSIDEQFTLNDTLTSWQLTVPVLKDWAHSKHISVAGKKADIVEKIEEYFEKK